MTISVIDPFTGKRFDNVPVPSVLMFGTEEKCVVWVLIGERSEWFKYRGPLTEEMRETLFTTRKNILHLGEKGMETIN